MTRSALIVCLTTTFCLSATSDIRAQSTSGNGKKKSQPQFYRIVNGGSGKAVSIPAGKTNDGDKAVQSTVAKTDEGQQWEFQRGRAGGWFRIVNRKTKKVLSVVGDAKSNGAAVAQWAEDKRAVVQLWKRVPVDRQRTYYWLVNGHGGKVLGVLSGSTADGAALVVWDLDRAAPNQKWRLDAVTDAKPVAKSKTTPPKKSKGKPTTKVTKTGKPGKTKTSPPKTNKTNAKLPTDGWYKILNRHSGKAIGVLSRSKTNGGPIVQWQFVPNEPNQHWKFESAGKGLYYLINRNSGKALGSPSSRNAGRGLVQWDKKDGDEQKWKLVHTGDGWFRIINSKTSGALGINGPSRNNGAAVNQSASKTTAAHQLWKLELLK